eukprot:COSAG01_NODE_5460_length_4252_cov_7.235974_2_plen_115_part_00
MAADRCGVLCAATQRHNVKFVKLPKHAPPLARVQALRDLRPGEVGPLPPCAGCGCGADLGIDRHENWLRFPYDSIFPALVVSHSLSPHPCALLGTAVCGMCTLSGRARRAARPR